MVNFFYHPDFAEILANSFPFGLLIVDAKGRVETANGILEKTFNVNKTKISGINPLFMIALEHHKPREFLLRLFNRVKEAF